MTTSSVNKGSTASLEKVAMVAKSEENRAASHHQRQQAAASQSQQRLGQLEQFRAEYEQRLEKLASTGIDARQMVDYRKFLGSLNDAIVRQTQEVVKSEAQVEGSREQLIDRTQRRESLDSLVERSRAVLLKEADRREQRLSDERNLQQHGKPA